MSLEENKELLKQMQWLKPFLQIVSTRKNNQHLIKLCFASIQRFASLHESNLAQIAFTERVINGIVLVLINCKFDEIDLQDTCNISVLILKV